MYLKNYKINKLFKMTETKQLDPRDPALYVFPPIERTDVSVTALMSGLPETEPESPKESFSLGLVRNLCEQYGLSIKEILGAIKAGETTEERFRSLAELIVDKEADLTDKERTERIEEVYLELLSLGSSLPPLADDEALRGLIKRIHEIAGDLAS